MSFQQNLLNILSSIHHSLEKMTASPPSSFDFSMASRFVWQGAGLTFTRVKTHQIISLDLLKAIDQQKQQLLENSQQFALGYPANNALLWGTKGMGKSSLVKAVHAHLQAKQLFANLKLVEIHREDIHTLPACLPLLRETSDRFILYCDDLSFDDADSSYKSLKAVLEGGLEGKPENVIFYATSNRRHLMPRDMIESEQSTAIHPSESIEEKVSLSDRFGLWIGFHNSSQQEYLAMIESYANHFGLDQTSLESKAIEWAALRGARSGRVAWQFIQNEAGKQRKYLKR